jgi:N-acetylglucosamine kinase-like BadF-type ATPase
MIVIADSGSTKTTWVLSDQKNGTTHTVQTSGINPFYQDETGIKDMLNNEFSFTFTEIQEIHFYGAGCTNSSVNNIVKKALSAFFSTNNIEVESDLMAAARSLCQHNAGIACILGTGSNSCYYNGKTIEQQVSPLGFILGDEGSGAVLGKRLIADILKNQLPQTVVKKFFETYKTTQQEIMENIYRKPFPNRYAAKFTRFIGENIDQPALQKLVATEFDLFFRRNVLQYPMAVKLPVHLAGSIAWYFSDILKKVAQKHKLTIGKIEQAPMAGLLQYHYIQQ